MILQEIIFSIFISGFAFILLLILTRLMGRKSISQMTLFDFVVGITIGTIAAILAVSFTRSVYSTLAVLITITALKVITDFIHVKSIKLSKLIDSEPVVVINNGLINDQNMKKLRLTAEDLTTLLREKNVFNPSDVEFALLENDGKLSVLLKSQKQPLTPSDMHLPTTYKGLTKDIIIDGKIMTENLEYVNLDEMWLYNQLVVQGIQDASDVFYAGLDTAGNLYVSKKNKTTEEHGQCGIE